MRQAFTLIELMIVIAIIAIIAAIAIPNLLESRITANESAAAASLKSGIFAGEVQFSAGAYSDMDGDGRGEYATNHMELAGMTHGSTGTTKGENNTARVLTLIAPTFNVADGNPIGAYRYQIDTDTTAYSAGTGTSEDATMSNGETFWGAYAAPAVAGSDGRRAFGIALSGVVYATKANIADTSLILATIATAGSGIFLTSPTSSNPANLTTFAVPYQK
jgi:prepilin-type N-terminal cleavage/methylation domain-containing protein